MRVHNVTIASEPDQPHLRFLMSDLHLCSPNADEGKIVADLDKARALGARVLINGDVFDGILPSDRKRFDADTLIPALRGSKDLFPLMVDHAYSILSPYRDIIDVMGIGNHEESCIRYYHHDPVAALLAKLNEGQKDGHRIAHGSFWGYICTEFDVKGVRAIPRHRLLYYHGTGGDSPVTKGTIDFARKGRSWDYDAITFGHKHNRTVTVERKMLVDDKGRIVEYDQHQLQTGSYYRNYTQINDEADVLNYSYAARSAHPPKPLGGLYLTLRPIREGRRWIVAQDASTDIHAAPARKKRAA